MSGGGNIHIEIGLAERTGDLRVQIGVPVGAWCFGIVLSRGMAGQSTERHQDKK